MAKTFTITNAIQEYDSVYSATDAKNKIIPPALAAIAITEPSNQTIVVASASTIEIDFGGVADAKVVYFTADEDITYQLDISGTPGADDNPLPADGYFLEGGPTATGIVGVSITTTVEPTTITYYIA
jgi:hypothetical protein